MMVRHLNVFVAYASDVEEEQKAAFRAIDRLNGLIRDIFGLHLEPKYWKQEPPGGGRPQDKFNPMVDACDLFLGIVGLSWGEPPGGDGEYSSGFHEEFERASQRLETTGEPNIFLYLKEIPAGMLKDPGPKILTNVQFRATVKKSKRLTYKEFGNASRFDQIVFDDIFKYLTRRFTLQSQKSAPPATQPRGREAMDLPINLAIDPQAKAARSDLETIAVKLADVLGDQGTDIDRSQSMPVTTLELSRLMILMNCWMSQYHTGELLGNHQINLLYSHRKGMELLNREREYVLRNVFGNKYAPGWYWLRDVPTDSLLDAIVRIIREDPSAESRVQAVRWLTDAKIGHNVVRNWDTRMLRSGLSDGSSDVRTLALRYVSEVASESDLEAVRSELENKQLITPEAAFNAELHLRLRYDVKAAFRMGSKEPEKVSSQGADALAKNFATIDESTLKAIATSSNKYFSVIGAEELMRRGLLLTPWIRDHLGDSNLDTRRVYCLVLIRNGSMKTLDRLKTWKQVYLQVEDTENNLGLGGFFQRVTDRDLDSALLGEYTFADLNTEVTWLSGLAPIAYSVLCNRFWDKWADRTRLDLDIGFASLKDEWLASAKDELRRAFLESAEKELSGKVIPDNILQAVDQMVDERIANDYTVDSETELYVNSRFIQSALDGVSAHGCKNDVRFFRKYLNHQNPEVRLSALNGLARFGSNEDLGPILALVHDEDSRVRHLAAETAIHLAPGIDGAGPKLFDSSDPLIPGTGIKALLDTDIKSAADLVRPLLGHSEYAVRRDAFIFFKRRYSGDQLEQLLDDYISSGGYHYDVVCWLDRHLYGPDFFRKISI